MNSSFFLLNALSLTKINWWRRAARRQYNRQTRAEWEQEIVEDKVITSSVVESVRFATHSLEIIVQRSVHESCS